MSKIQKILLKRTQKTLAQSSADPLDFGEFEYIKDGNGYLATGAVDSTTVGNSKLLKYQDKVRIDNSVFYTGTSAKTQLTNDAGTNLLPLTVAENVSYGDSTVQESLDDINTYLYGEPPVPVPEATHSSQTDTITTQAATTGKYYILGVADTTANTFKQLYHASANASATENKGGIYFDQTGVLVGAAWNDFAEYRECEVNTPGLCVVESKNGKLIASRKHKLPAAYIISDTYGMVIGDDELENKAPVAVAGRVLAFVEKKEKLKIGDALKTAPGGRLAKMGRLEIMLYPDRIVGYVSEIPTYEVWNNVEINDRIWVKIK